MRGSALRHPVAVALGVAAIGMGGPAHSAAPLSGPPLDLVAHNQPLAGFLQALVARDGLHVVLDPKIHGAVNGAFHGTPAQILEQVMAGFGLFAYTDSNTVFVQALASMRTVDIPLAPAQAREVVERLQRRGATDRYDRVEARDNGLNARGSEAFLRVVRLAVRSSPPPAAVAPAETVAESQTEYRVYYLRYAWATDQKVRSAGQFVTVPGLVSVLRPLISQVSAGTGPSRSMAPATQPRLGGGGLIAQADKPPSPLSVASLGAALAAARADPPRPAEAPAQTTAGEGEGPRLEADPRLNAIVIRDTPARLDAYGALIKALDVEPQLVEIEAQIIDVDIEQAAQRGFSLDFQDRSGRTSITLSPGPPGLTAPGQGGVLSTVIRAGGNLSLTLKALETSGVARVTSRPAVLTLSDVEAVFGDSQTFFVPVAGSLNSDLFNVTAGTTLRVMPHVLRDGGPARIRMLVSIDDGKVGDRNVANIPVVDNAELNTQAMIEEGQSLLVGGMVVQSDRRVAGKVPLLGDLPLLRSLFRSSDRSTSRVERLFLITPRLADPGHSPPTPGEPQTKPSEPAP